MKPQHIPAAISISKMTDGQRKKHKAAHDASISQTSQAYGRDARIEPIMESSSSRPSLINSSRKTLQELIDERHQTVPETQFETRAYLDIPDEDHPPAAIDDMFIPEPDQVRTTWSQWDDTMTPIEPEVWLQDANQRHYTRWSGHWWRIESFAWQVPRRGRPYWMPSTWSRRTDEEMANIVNSSE